jgi:pSer/pThr/pTyr-binding forkhead associated (FHA) protein
MFSWLRSILGQKPVERAARGEPNTCLDDILKSPGKPPSAQLLALANSISKEEFIDVVFCPSLVGSAIRDGSIGSPSRVRAETSSFQTFVFTSTEVHALVEGQTIEQSIFLLRKDSAGHNSTSYTQFTVGRSKESEVRIVDFTISRRHALIRLSNDGFTLQDCNSRNGTKLNGTSVFGRPVPLKDGDSVSLGRYDFTFLLPGSLYSRLKKSG